MGHEIVKSELLTAEKIQEMKFNKENFNTLQEMSLTQIAEIKTYNDIIAYPEIGLTCSL